MPIFMKLAIYQRNCVQVSCTEFYPRQSISVESTGRNLFTLLSKLRLSLGRFSWNSLLHNFLVESL
jgi:hypothetical protein